MKTSYTAYAILIVSLLLVQHIISGCSTTCNACHKEFNKDVETELDFTG